MDFKQLYKGVPKYYRYIGNTEIGEPIFMNKYGFIWTKYKVDKPESNYDDTKCWYCNFNVIGQCICKNKNEK